MRGLVTYLAVVFLTSTAFTYAQDAPAVPTPEKEDIPYLYAAGNLTPTEALESKEESKSKGKKNEETTYWIPGPTASIKTPLASPTFLLLAKDLPIEKLEVYPFEVKNGRREITFSRKKQVRGFSLTITKQTGSVYKLEVNESLPAGEYAITPSGSNQVFCFRVY